MRIGNRWYHGWNIVGICILSQMAGLGVMANCFSFFLADWSRTFDVPVSTMVLAITLFSIPCAFLAPIAGWVVDRYSVSQVMVGAMLGVALAHALIGFASQAWQVIAVYALILPFAITLSSGIPSQTLVSRWFVRRRGLAFSLCALGLVMAGVFYPPIVVYLISTFGWRETWWIAAGLDVVVVCSLMLLVLRDAPRPGEGADYVPESVVEEIEETDAGKVISVREILTRGNFWLALGCFIPVIQVNSVLSVNFAPLVASRGITLTEAAILLAVFNITAATGKLSAGFLADKYGNRLPLLLLCTSSAAGTLLLIFVSELIPIGLGLALIGFGQGLWVLLASCIASEFGPKGFARAYGFANMSSLITTLPSPIVAYAAEKTGSYTPALVLMVAGCGIAMLAAYCFRDRHAPVITPEQEAELAVANPA